MNQRVTKRRKSFVSRAGWFFFHYPEDWEVDEDEYIAVYNPKQGVGALHLSAYQGPSEIDPTAELIEHLSQKEVLADNQRVKTSQGGRTTIASCDSVRDGSFEKVWFVAANSYLVIATYNCDSGDEERELPEIEDIVQSIEITPQVSRN
jgi:Domain of unknown function (DUF3805)